AARRGTAGQARLRRQRPGPRRRRRARPVPAGQLGVRQGVPMLTDAQRAAITQRLRRGQPADAGTIPRRGAGLEPPPLSYGQEQLWFIDRFAPGLPTYHIPLVLR